MTEKKMGLVEGVLTDLKIMMDAAPLAMGMSGGSYSMANNGYEFEPTPEYLNAISGPVPLQKNEVEEVIPDEYQQTIEQAMSGATSEARNLQIDELGSVAAGLPSINVTKLSPDLDSLTVKELQTLAKENSISVPTGTRRKEMIELIKKATSESKGTALVPQADAPNGIQGSLLASFDGSAPVDGTNF